VSREPGKQRRVRRPDVNGHGGRPGRALIAGRRERDVVGVRSGGVELAVRCQGVRTLPRSPPAWVSQ
jgi:hypothetical protein